MLLYFVCRASLEPLAPPPPVLPQCLCVGATWGGLGSHACACVCPLRPARWRWSAILHVLLRRDAVTAGTAPLTRTGPMSAPMFVCRVSPQRASGARCVCLAR